MLRMDTVQESDYTFPRGHSPLLPIGVFAPPTPHPPLASRSGSVGVKPAPKKKADINIKQRYIVYSAALLYS
jgi:hypothetical protein